MDRVAGKKAALTWLIHVSVALLVLVWLIPTLGLLISSFRDRDQINASGWWSAPFPVETAVRTTADGAAAVREGDVWVIEGNVFESPDVVRQLGEGAQGEVTGFSGSFREPGRYPAGETADLGDGASLSVAADGAYTYVLPEDPGDGGPRFYFAADQPPSFTWSNYLLLLRADNMDRAFLNTLTVSIPATIIPIVVAAYAAFALAWMQFPGRALLVAAVVGLLVVPLQIGLVPLLRLHQTVGIGQSFLGVWLAHTGYGLPLAIYLLRNYMVGLPRDIIECARVDGATDFQVFTRIVLPLSFPALAAFSIFQFLWTWNDLLVAKVFLPSNEASKVMTVKIADDLLGSRGGDWGILAAAAFISLVVPLIVFFAMQRYFVRGLLAGSIK